MSQSFGATRAARDVGQSIEAATAYVRGLPELWTTVLLGGLLWGYSLWLVLPGFFVMGYLLRVLRHVPPVTDEPDVTPLAAEPPKFDGWLSLLTDGFRAYVVWTAYLFFAFAGSLPFVEADASESLFFALLDSLLGNVSYLLKLRDVVGTGALRTSGVPLAELYPALLLFGLSMYVAPAALLNVAARGHLGDGFDFDALRPVLRSPTYARRWCAFVALWAVSTVIFLSPSGYIAEQVVPSGLPLAAELLRESIEILRGFASFLLLVVAYATLGGVSVPPTDRFSFRGTLSAAADAPLARLVGRSGPRFGVVLLGLFLLGSFWSIPAIVLLVGYLVRYVRAASLDESPPGFERLTGMVVDGGRVVLLWASYAVVPLTAAVLWTRSTALDSNLHTAMTGFLGTFAAAWYLARDCYKLLDQSLVGAQVGIPGGVLFATFVVTAIVVAYLFPIGFVRVATHRRLGAGYRVRAILATAIRPAYLKAWLAALPLFLLAEAFSLSWNWWRMTKAGHDTEVLVWFGPFNLVAVPTNLGLVSSSFLLVVSAIGVLLVLRAYDGIATAIARASAAESSDGESERPTDATPE